MYRSWLPRNGQILLRYPAREYEDVSPRSSHFGSIDDSAWQMGRLYEEALTPFSRIGAGIFRSSGDRQPTDRYRADLDLGLSNREIAGCDAWFASVPAIKPTAIVPHPWMSQPVLMLACWRMVQVNNSTWGGARHGGNGEGCAEGSFLRR